MSGETQGPIFGQVKAALEILQKLNVLVGDMIHSVNRTSIGSFEQLKSAVAQLKAGDAAELGIKRKGQFQYLAFEME
jgi:S1-C subfamily serine protease